MTFFYYPINKCAYEPDEPWFEPLATYKKSTSFEVLILNLGRTMRLEEKIISGGDYFNDRRSFVSFEKATAPSIKRYKTSDRSELANVMRLRARGGKNNLRWRLF